MAGAAKPSPDRWCAPSAKPERAPRTPAPPGSPGITPLGAARSTRGGTGRRCLGRGDAAPKLPGTDGQLNSVTSPDCAHPPARPRSWGHCCIWRSPPSPSSTTAPKRGFRHSGLIALTACCSPLGGKRLHFVTRRRRPSSRCNSAAYGPKPPAYERRRRPRPGAAGVCSGLGAVAQVHHAVAEPALVQQFELKPDPVGEELLA